MAIHDGPVPTRLRDGYQAYTVLLGISLWLKFRMGLLKAGGGCSLGVSPALTMAISTKSNL